MLNVISYLMLMVNVCMFGALALALALALACSQLEKSEKKQKEKGEKGRKEKKGIIRFSDKNKNIMG